jgi:hypothetical protein
MAAYLSAVMICATAVVLGAAVCARRGGWTWTAPAVGLSATMLLALGGVRLPGHATTAAALLAAAERTPLARLALRFRFSYLCAASRS